MTVLQNLQSLEVPFDVNRGLFLPDDEQPADSREQACPSLIVIIINICQYLASRQLLLGSGGKIDSSGWHLGSGCLCQGSSVGNDFGNTAWWWSFRFAYHHFP
eukprot:evm.model.NODE_4642_length_71726_cov_21.816496.2